MGRKLILLVSIMLFAASFAFGQTEVLKGVVNNLAYYKQKNELKYLRSAKKSIDSLIVTRADSANLDKNVYRALINSTILYVDSLNRLNQPAELFYRTVELVDRLDNSKKIYKYKPEIDFSKQCLSNIYIRKGFVFLNNSDFANAEQCFLRAQKYTPYHKQLNAYIAYVNNKTGNLQTAARYYDNLIKTDSNKTEYTEIAANIYKSIGDTAKAIKTIKMARKMAPADKFLLFDEASIYSNNKDYRSLASLLPTLLDNNINNPDIVFVAANCYDHLCEYDKAESLYLRTIELNSAAYEPVFNLGLLYLKKSTLNNDGSAKERNIKYAAQWINKASEITPNNIECLKVLQLIYAQTDNKDQLNKINNKLKQLTNQ